MEEKQEFEALQTKEEPQEMCASSQTSEGDSSSIAR